MSKFAYAALCGAAVSLAVSVPSQAQEAAITAGGDVTASEVTPLPPVVVEAPSRPLARKAAKKKASAGSSASAQGAPTSGDATGEGVAGDGVGVYTLGQLDMIGGSAITNEAMYTFNKNSLDQAVSILPGVMMQNSGGHRNERDIFVRGFNRHRVPLYMDGVRIYLPYDNRLDMNRFLTPDLAEIQVQKGYVSVLNGPGGMGGAINMVSRKPTKEIEIEGRAGLTLNGDLDDMNQWNAYAFAGTRQKGYYAQISGTIVDQDHFNLSNDFRPSGPSEPGYVASFPYEDGGNRDRSYFDDWRINAKVGITPNATDEYSINYTVQQGAKGAPLHVRRQVVGGYQGGIPNVNDPNGPPLNTQRYWNWPAWDISTLSWMSKTQLGSSSYVKTNVYYNTFENTTAFYPTATHPTPYIDSPYDDNSYGGFVEFGTELIPMNTLKGAIHYRRDTHNEAEIQYNLDGTVAGVDPNERDAEETWSFAVENTFHATRYLDIVGGLSYDTNKVLEAYGSGEPLPEKDAWNWQTAAIYSYSRDGTVHASVSSRTRFPTLFDRYSTRFGSKSENPGIEPERATNYEIGASDVFGDVKLSGAVFYSDIKDSIESIFFNANGNTSIAGFNADGETYGFELSADWDVTRTFRVGGNYTYMERNLDFASASATLDPILMTVNGQQVINQTETDYARNAVAHGQVEGSPRHKAFLYASWQATRALTLTPSLELASDRTVLVTSCESTLVNAGATNNNSTCTKSGPAGTRTPSYKDLGSYALVDFRADSDFTENFSAAVGVTNLLDQNYSLAEGFPEAGRQFYLTARAKF